MRILVACEQSGIVRDLFITAGHEAVSCDLELSARPGPHWTCDVRHILKRGWDMMIAFPPCTYLAGSGIHWNSRRPERQVLTVEAMHFFMELAQANIPRICIENPVGIMSTQWRRPDQIIQPWMFGEPFAKRTCLWLKGLPLLRPTNVLPRPASGRWSNQTPSGQNNAGEGPNRARKRSRTFVGVAQAMAEQWGINELPPLPSA